MSAAHQVHGPRRSTPGRPVTTPAGVPNLPLGALTVGTLADKLQNHGVSAQRRRANERMPEIFASSTGGDIASDLSPFGIIANIWSGVNSLIANADPADIQGPEDIPALLIEFIEGLPIVGQFVALLGDLFEVFQGVYEGDDTILLAIQDFLAPLIGFLRYVFGGFLGDFITGGVSYLKPVFEWLGFFWGLFGEAVEGVLNPILEFVKWAWETLNSIFGGTADQILRAIVGGIEWVWVNIGEPVVKAVGGLVEWVAGVVNIETLTAVLDDITGFLGQFFSLQGFADMAKSLFSWAQGVIDDFGDFVSGIPLMSDLIEFVRQITGVFSIENLQQGLTELIGWTQQIPVVGSLVSALIPAEWRHPVTGAAASTVADLASFANTEIMTFSKPVPAYLLAGDSLPQRFLANIPIGNIAGFSAPNLLADGGFSAASVLESGNGWSWDPTQNYPGSEGGSAKVVCSGGAKQLFSNLIPVDPKQKITLGVAIRWAALVSTGSPIVLGVRTYNGSSVVSTQVLASKASPGSSGGWSATNRLTATYTVPDAGVNGLRMMIGVTTASSGTVWFDMASLSKSGLLPQSLIDSLLSDLGLLTPMQNFQGLLNALGSKVGAQIVDVITRLEAFLTGNSTLNGDRITTGNIVGDRIADFMAFIGEVFRAITGNALPATSAAAGAAVVGTQMAGQSDTIKGQSTAIQTLQAALTAGMAFTDDFERSTLGGNWQVQTRLSDGSSLGILGGADAFFDAPALTAQDRNRVTAVYAPGGTPAATLTPYQVVSTVIGRAGQSPLLGDPGHNDLLLRVGGSGANLFCVIARVFANGQVVILRRNGTPWSESVIAGPTASGILPVTGTRINAYAGDKTAGDPTRFWIRINDRTVVTGLYSAPAQFGLGLGFGMGNGISVANPQKAGSMNFWSGCDQ